MASNPNKSVDKYIEQGELILKSDQVAEGEGKPWALVNTMRGLLHTRLSTLKVKSRRLDELTENLSRAVERKSTILSGSRDIILELAVYIENAFFFDYKEINAKLMLDKKPPTSDSGLLEFIELLLLNIEEHDNKKFPIPEKFITPLKSTLMDIKPVMAEIDHLKSRKAGLVRERETALEGFREILPPIRKWLWKMLPDGRSDEKLTEYGFKAYGK